MADGATSGEPVPALGALGPARAALHSAADGLLAGALAYAATGTLKVMLSPGLAVDSPEGWVARPILVFSEGLAWGLAGGALVLLPTTFLAFLALARRARPAAKGAKAGVPAALGIWLALFAPLFVLGLRGRLVDGLLVGFSIGLGLRRGLGRLARRTAP